MAVVLTLMIDTFFFTSRKKSSSGHSCTHITTRLKPTSRILASLSRLFFYMLFICNIFANNSFPLSCTCKINDTTFSMTPVMFLDRIQPRHHLLSNVDLHGHRTDDKCLYFVFVIHTQVSELNQHRFYD